MHNKFITHNKLDQQTPAFTTSSCHGKPDAQQAPCTTACMHNAKPGMLCTLCRLVRRQEETKAQRGQMKQLKGLMHGLVNVTGDPAKQQLDAIRNARELAFLITDLQDSTAMASANPVAFRKVQDIHDTVSS